MPQYGEPLYGESIYGPMYGQFDVNAGGIDYLKRVVDSLPWPYRPPEVRDFLERVYRPSAEDLARVNWFFDLLYTLVDPYTAPEEWIDWILIEWLGWKLIPEGYPLERKRRFLANLHAHYKRRYTTGRNTSKSYATLEDRLKDPASGEGIKLLLREFGIFAEVYDQPMFWGGFWKQHGAANTPLNVRVRVFGYEAFYHPVRTTVGSFWGPGCFYHKNKNVITQPFVMALINWSRAAGVRFLVEWVTTPWRPYPLQAIQEDALMTSAGEMLGTEGGIVIGVNE
jgi:hypothetical protein